MRLALQHLCKTYAPHVVAVDDVSLDVDSGQLVVLLGPSGCGKTTLLRLIAGLERPEGGTIAIAGRPVVSASQGLYVPPEHRAIGMVFQSYAIWPHMTVYQNVAYALKNKGLSKSEIKRKVAQVLELVELQGLMDRPAPNLSGGQQQRVALARALVSEPQVLLFDEPLSNLDAKLRHQMRSELRRLQRDTGITAVYVTHDQEEALSISDRIVVMYEGRIEQVGSPFEIYNFPKTAFVASFVGTLNTAKAEVVDPGKRLLQIDGVQLQSAEDLDGKQKGDQVTIAIRPERFNFIAQEKKANILDCTIENITFLGSVVRVQVSVSGNRFYMDTFNNPFLELPKIGDKDQVTCSREAVLVLKG